MNDIKKKDALMWSTWRSDPSRENLSALLGQVNPILQKEVNRWSGGSVSSPVLNVNAKKLAIQAFETFDPNKSALNTHVTNNLKGLSRDPYTYVNPARMPEHRQIKFKTFTDSEERLLDTLGRQPTAQEMSRDLRWSLAEVSRFRSELRSEFSTSQPTPAAFDSVDRTGGVLAYVYHDLPDVDKLVLEHSTGYGGATILPAKDLTSLTGLSQGQISHSKRRIRKAIESVSGLGGS
jgi:hypothetical protein